MLTFSVFCNWWICFYLQYRFTITTSTNIFITPQDHHCLTANHHKNIINIRLWLKIFLSWLKDKVQNIEHHFRQQPPQPFNLSLSPNQRSNHAIFKLCSQMGQNLLPLKRAILVQILVVSTAIASPLPALLHTRSRLSLTKFTLQESRTVLGRNYDWWIQHNSIFTITMKLSLKCTHRSEIRI